MILTLFYSAISLSIFYLGFWSKNNRNFHRKHPILFWLSLCLMFIGSTFQFSIIKYEKIIDPFLLFGQKSHEINAAIGWSALFFGLSYLYLISKMLGNRDLSL